MWEVAGAANLLQPALAVRKSVAAKPVNGVPQTYLEAMNYVAGLAQPNAFPPTTVFNQSQQNEGGHVNDRADDSPALDHEKERTDQRQDGPADPARSSR